MTLTPEQIKALQKMLALTKSKELTCEECQARMAEFAETVLASLEVPDDLREIEHHLSLCGECMEEFKGLIAALGERG